MPLPAERITARLPYRACIPPACWDSTNTGQICYAAPVTRSPPPTGYTVLPFCHRHQRVHLPFFYAFPGPAAFSRRFVPLPTIVPTCYTYRCLPHLLFATPPVSTATALTRITFPGFARGLYLGLRYITLYGCNRANSLVSRAGYAAFACRTPAATLVHAPTCYLPPLSTFAHRLLVVLSPLRTLPPPRFSGSVGFYLDAIPPRVGHIPADLRTYPFLPHAHTTPRGYRAVLCLTFTWFCDSHLPTSFLPVPARSLNAAVVRTPRLICARATTTRRTPAILLGCRWDCLPRFCLCLRFLGCGSASRLPLDAHTNTAQLPFYPRLPLRRYFPEGSLVPAPAYAPHARGLPLPCAAYRASFHLPL